MCYLIAFHANRFSYILDSSSDKATLFIGLEFESGFLPPQANIPEL